MYPRHAAGNHSRAHMWLSTGYDLAMHEMTDRFTEALHRLHANSDAEALVALFSSDATLAKLDGHHGADGRDGARQSWGRTTASVC